LKSQNMAKKTSTKVFITVFLLALIVSKIPLFLQTPTATAKDPDGKKYKFAYLEYETPDGHVTKYVDLYDNDVVGEVAKRAVAIAYIIYSFTALASLLILIRIPLIFKSKTLGIHYIDFIIGAIEGNLSPVGTLMDDCYNNIGNPYQLDDFPQTLYSNFLRYSVFVVVVLMICINKWVLAEKFGEHENPHTPQTISLSETKNQTSTPSDNSPRQRFQPTDPEQVTLSKPQPSTNQITVLEKLPLDCFSLLFICLSRQGSQSLHPRSARLLLMFLSIVVIAVQIVIFLGVVRGTDRHHFLGNESMLSSRIMAVIFVLILQLGDFLQGACRVVTSILVADSVLVGDVVVEKRKAFAKRFVLVAAFALQIFISILTVSAVMVSVMKLEDEDGYAGVAAELTSLLILTELDNIGYPAVVGIATLRNKKINEDMLDEVRDQVLEECVVPYSKSMEFLTDRIYSPFSVGFLGGYLVQLIFYADRFAHKVYVGKAD